MVSARQILSPLVTISDRHTSADAAVLPARKLRAAVERLNIETDSRVFADRVTNAAAVPADKVGACIAARNGLIGESIATAKQLTVPFAGDPLRKRGRPAGLDVVRRAVLVRI